MSDYNSYESGWAEGYVAGLKRALKITATLASEGGAGRVVIDALQDEIVEIPSAVAARGMIRSDWARRDDDLTMDDTSP